MFKKCLVALILVTFFMPMSALAYTPPSDILPVMERNQAIADKALEIKSMLQNEGEAARENPEFIASIREFLDLVVENKNEYMAVLRERILQNEILSVEEKNEILDYVRNDLTFFQAKREALQNIQKWEEARQLGNDVRSYSQTIAPRIKGMAGLKLVNRAKALVNRSNNIRIKLEESASVPKLAVVEEEADAPSLDINISDNVEPSMPTLRIMPEISTQKFNILEQNINLADQKVDEAKDSMLQMIRLETVPSIDAIVKLKAARQNLKSARQNSLELTIDIIKAKVQK